MQDRDMLKVEYLPKGGDNPQFSQRESGVSHTPYSREVAFYSCVRNGDVEGVKNGMASFMGDALVVGRMSDDNLRQTKYFAVSCITLATRYAVEGGLMESEAYNLSDRYIQRIDKMNTPQEITAFLVEKAIEITYLVGKHKQRLEYPPYIRKAIKYISAHLHEKLSGEDIAIECGISADYLSQKFKECVGQSLHRYVLLQKLEASKELLSGDMPYGEIGYYFGFCSQTHYIRCFEKAFGMTPRAFAKANATI